MKVKIIKKAVLKSFLPEICAEIINNKCSELPSNNKPREVKPPFKCYIYCPKKGNFLIRADNSILNGTIIGEFICTQIKNKEHSCILIPTNIQIYDNPKKLSEFQILFGTLNNWCYVEELEGVNYEN